MHRLNCAIQTYSWGKRGEQSKVALFKRAAHEQFEINPTQTYAELWMGTHTNGPSHIELQQQQQQQKLLADYLNENEHVLCSLEKLKSFKEYFSLAKLELPFLFKVLSINQALSIQAHPNKQLARVLHVRDPKNYPDANHKPEMLIALNKFEALCGFRAYNEIARHFMCLPQLVSLCERANVEQFILSHSELSKNDCLKKCFHAMMSKSSEFVSEQCESLVNAFKTGQDELKDGRDELSELFLRLHSQYGNDIGCFSIFLLNYVTLNETEAIYLKANVPHAYLSGDGVECMACSDNVVRAGLTPKFKDVQTLVDMLDYEMNTIDINKVQAVKLNEHLSEYKPNVDEFAVQLIQFSKKIQQSTIELPKLNSASILIIIQNDLVNLVAYVDNAEEYTSLVSGQVYFIDANRSVSLKLSSAVAVAVIDENAKFVAYRAYCDLDSVKI
jgi:mannose-6-phosphate isomerase